MTNDYRGKGAGLPPDLHDAQHANVRGSNRAQRAHRSGLVSACIASSTGSPEPMQVVGQTAISCPTCPAVTVTGVADGDTIDTSIGRIRL